MQPSHYIGKYKAWISAKVIGSVERRSKLSFSVCKDGKWFVIGFYIQRPKLGKGNWYLNWYKFQTFHTCSPSRWPHNKVHQLPPDTPMQRPNQWPVEVSSDEWRSMPNMEIVTPSLFCPSQKDTADQSSGAVTLWVWWWFHFRTRFWWKWMDLALCICCRALGWLSRSI